MVLDYSRNSDKAVVKRMESVFEVPKKFLKRADCEDLQRHFTISSQCGDLAYSVRKERSPTSLEMPLRYEVIGCKAVAHGGSFITVFFLLVTPYSAHSHTASAAIGSNTPFHYTRDSSWVVAKSARCVDKLIGQLERYTGEGNLPSARSSCFSCCSVKDDPYLRKPEHWALDQWLAHRTQAMADFFLEFKNPKRGYYLGNSGHKREVAAAAPLVYTQNPLLGSVMGGILRSKPVADAFTLQLQEEAEEMQNLLSNKHNNKYLNGKGGLYVNHNDAAELAAAGSREGSTATEHLIHGLPPLIQFLHTDKVTIEATRPVHSRQQQSSASSESEGGSGSCSDGHEDGAERGGQAVPHYELSDAEVVHAVQNGDFSISPLTPIDSLLRIWAVAGLDNRDDHRPAGVDPAQWQLGAHRWEAPEENMMSEWATDGDSDENEAREDSDSSRGGGDYEHSDDSSDEDYDFDNIYSDGPGSDREAGKQKYSRQDMFADRAARTAIMGIQSAVLRKRLWAGFVESPACLVDGDDAHARVGSSSAEASVQSTLTALKQSLTSIEDYLVERQDAHEGLESFSHFGLMIFSTAVARRGEQDGRGTGDDEDDCSVGSLTPVAHGAITKSLSSVTNDSREEINESLMARLNKNVHTLFLEWEHRRETAKERINAEKKASKRKEKSEDGGKGASKLTAVMEAVPSISALAENLKNCCYKRSPVSSAFCEDDTSTTSISTGRQGTGRQGTCSQSKGSQGNDRKSSGKATSGASSSGAYLPYPSQMRCLAPLSASRLDDYITNRSKTLLSRKSERVLIIDRMKAAEKLLQSRRVTCLQMRRLLSAMEGPDERQHAALLLVVRLTDVVETDAVYDLFRQLEMPAECEKRVRLAAAVLSAEARAEDHLLAIQALYCTCFDTGQRVRQVACASKEDEDADYARLQSIHKLKDAQSVSPKLQSGMRNKIKDFRADISQMRHAAAEVHAALTAGFTVHLAEIRAEQEAIVKLTGEMKLVVIQCESVCRMRGTLTAGRPEYLVFHRLKAGLVSAEKAKSIAGQVMDEAAALLSSMQKILTSMEVHLAATVKASAQLLKQVSDSSCSASGDALSNCSASPARVEKELEEYLQDDQGSLHEGTFEGYVPIDRVSSVAMKTGLTAACAGAGWRRALHEISIENFSKFQSLISPQQNMSCFDDTRGEVLPDCDGGEQSSYLRDASYMCLLLSRIPILKDMRLAALSSEEVQKAEAAAAATTAGSSQSSGTGGGNVTLIGDGGQGDEESMMTYDYKEDEFSFAGVYA